jgi:hypothetical protein
VELPSYRTVPRLNNYTSITWSEVSRIEFKLNEINKMECEFLAGIDFNLTQAAIVHISECGGANLFSSVHSFNRSYYTDAEKCTGISVGDASAQFSHGSSLLFVKS